jgi:hypothetical protein
VFPVSYCPAWDLPVALSVESTGTYVTDSVLGESLWSNTIQYCNK